MSLQVSWCLEQQVEVFISSEGNLALFYSSCQIRYTYLLAHQTSKVLCKDNLNFSGSIFCNDGAICECDECFMTLTHVALSTQYIHKTWLFRLYCCSRLPISSFKSHRLTISFFRNPSF